MCHALKIAYQHKLDTTPAFALGISQPVFDTFIEGRRGQIYSLADFRTPDQLAHGGTQPFLVLLECSCERFRAVIHRRWRT